MKKEVVFCIIILILITGCIKVKNPNCPAVAGDESVIDVIGQGTVTNIGQPLTEDEKVQSTAVKPNTSPDPNTVIKEVTAGELVSFPNLDATDPDGEAITYKFSKPLNAKGEWQTTDSDVGEYKTIITISDGSNELSQKVLIRVLPKNNPPKILAPEEMTVQEGASLDIPLEVTDPENDKTSIRYSGWVTSVPYSVKKGDEGVHIVRIHASDGYSETVHEVQVTVIKQNNPPVIEDIEDIVINESSKITVNPKITDADRDEISIAYSAPLNNLGTWTPGPGDEGRHEIFITATDGIDQSSLSFFIIVEAVNKAPVITGLEDMTVKEGETIKLNFVVNDPEGEEVLTQISGYMNATTKVVPYDDAGVHSVRVTASDGEKSTTKTFIVTVEEVNRPPVFTPDAFN